MKSKLFSYAIIKNVTEKQSKDGKKAAILVSPKTVLGTDERTVGMLAAREIPEAEMENIDNIEIVVTPF